MLFWPEGGREGEREGGIEGSREGGRERGRERERERKGRNGRHHSKRVQKRDRSNRVHFFRLRVRSLHVSFHTGREGGFGTSVPGTKGETETQTVGKRLNRGHRAREYNTLYGWPYTCTYREHCTLP